MRSVGLGPGADSSHREMLAGLASLPSGAGHRAAPCSRSAASARRRRRRARGQLLLDVVRGRYTDEEKADCHLHQKNADKGRLKTNLDVHIDHIKNSGVRDALRLLKLFRCRKDLRIKQFAYEPLIIELLKNKKMVCTKPMARLSERPIPRRSCGPSLCLAPGKSGDIGNAPVAATDGFVTVVPCGSVNFGKGLSRLFPEGRYPGCEHM